MFCLGYSGYGFNSDRKSFKNGLKMAFSRRRMVFVCYGF